MEVPPEEVVVKVSRSGGPGGQHANTSETRVELAWDVATSAAPSDAQRALLLERLGPVVRAVAEDTRSQARNRELAFERLAQKVA
ncbi:MAG TPA: peptide chain release factor-like protein, partial [Acidimicrobiales bacterium]|nr:peptide chain release factor-like protein [Acidimicrobiales bacterium]